MAHQSLFWCTQLASSVGNSNKVVVRLRPTRGKMSEEHSGGHAESGFVGSSRESTWRERRHKRCKDREREREEEQSGLGEGLYQTHRTIPGALGHRQFDERDQELERLLRLVIDLQTFSLLKKNCERFLNRLTLITCEIGQNE